MVGNSCWFLSTVPLEQAEWSIRSVGQPWWIARVLIIFILWGFVYPLERNKTIDS